jgi:hypothetical protein
VSTATCAARPSAKGADTLQNRQVRSASAREREAPAPDEPATVETGSPSGPRPSVAGSRRMTAAARGTITPRKTRPAAVSARVKPIPLRSSTGRARPPVRRAVLHGCLDHSNLLPPNLSGEAGQVAQRRLLSLRGRRRARGIPPLLAVSSGSGARDARVAGRRRDGLPSGAAPRGWLPRRWPDRRGSRRCARHDRSASPPSVRALRGRLAHGCRDDPAGTAREGAGRRDHAADVCDRLRRGVREHPTVQRRIPRDVSPVADRRPPGSPAARAATVESHPRSLTPGRARRMVRAQGNAFWFQYAKA